MKNHLMSSTIVALFVTGIVAGGAGGCRSTEPTTSKPVPVPAGGFLAQWRAPIQLPSGDTLLHMYLRDDTVYVTTKSNHAYALAASGGQITQGYALPKTASSVQPPYVTKDYVVFPASSTLQVYNRAGKLLRAIEIGHNVRSPLAGIGNYVYAGLDFPNGARLAKIDLNKEYANTRWELLTGAGVSAAPAYWQPQTAVFAGAEDGTVYAINEERAPIWSLPKNVFKTDGRILGDLKVDDFGLYVASTDSKLYCLDRATGKIKWQYYASSSLNAAPVVTADTIYQTVPGKGVTAIDKASGEYNRKPRWVAPGTTQFLSQDDVNVYLRRSDNSVVAVDRRTGTEKSRSKRHDLDVFATNAKDSMIYAATSSGTVYAVRPVNRPGSVGEIVRGDDDGFEYLRLASAE